MKPVKVQKIRNRISKLLGEENGISIAAVYTDVQIPYKRKYISYNNLKNRLVYSIIIIDNDRWIAKLSKLSKNYNEIFSYYGFVITDDRWMLKS